MSISTEGQPNHPLVYAQPPHIKCAIAYNPFDLTDIGKHELVYDQTKTLADYLQGLPTEAGWTVAYNNEVVEPEQWAEITPAPYSYITIVRTPEGGRGGAKQALRVVALIAVAVFAQWAAPLVLGAMGVTATSMTLAMATTAIVAVGGMVVNAILPATAGIKSEKEESKSYGIDGPKNTAKEGAAIPVGYGEYRIAGNIVDMFTRNSGKDQYLFIRTVLNHGEIESIEDIEINGEPLSTFENVQVRKRFGKATELPNDWFDESTRLINQTIHIDQDWQERTTTGEVDRLRVDIQFPYGLYSIDQDDGVTKDPREVTLELEYAPCDQLGTVTGAWAPFPIIGARPTTETVNGYQMTSDGTETATVEVQTVSYNGYNYRIEGFYRKVGTTEWVSAGPVTGKAAPNGTGWAGVLDPQFPSVSYTFHFPDRGQYELRVEGGDITEGSAIGSETIQTSLTIRDKTNQPKRLTYEGAIVPRGYYKVRVRRTTPEKQANGKSPVDYVYDEVYLTEIGEIDKAPVNLNGIANLSLVIKANEQLTSIPTVTAKCRISKVNIYDEDGNVLENRWSDNPADIVVDILHHPIRGAGYAISKTVWSKYVEFREHCEAEGLKFNGVFDTVNSLWDAVQSVAKVGHGTIVPRGTKFSFAIDKAADPVALFTPSNIVQDTFKKTWLSLTDRANEIQLTFSDAESGYKEATVRLADFAAFSRGAKQKIATVPGFGITSLEQAHAEAEYNARQNSYIRSFVEFEAPLEAIGLTIGDVALIQHDSVDFNGGVGGRFEAGSTTTSINLDRPVTMLAGKQYCLLGFHSALKRFDVEITGIIGSRISVTGLPDVEPTALARVLRLKQGSADREIVDVRKAGSAWTLIVVDNDGLTPGAAELWDLDVIEERTVTTVAGEHETVTVTQPFSLPPEKFANFLFGEKTSVKLPFRLRKISGNGIESRTLSFVQYDERCYQRGGWDVPAVTRPGANAVPQVKNLTADWTRAPLPDQDRIPVTLTWQMPDGVLYGGADVHIFEDERWRQIATVTDATSWRGDFSRGESVKFKVVGFDQNKVRARFSDAPMVTAGLDIFEITLQPPTNVLYELWWRTDATARVSWTASANADNRYEYRVERKAISQADHDALVVDPTNPTPAVSDNTDYLVAARTSALQADVPRLDLGYYAIRVRAERGFHASPWVYLAVHVEAADIPIAITGLTLVGGTQGPDAANDIFNTADAHWTWDDVLAQQSTVIDPKTNLPLMLQDYRVRIYDDEGVLVRTEFVTSPNYTYSITKNAEDSAALTTIRARRVFRIEVCIRGKQGQLGYPSAMRVTNPAPPTPSGIGNREDVNGILVNWTACDEPDYADTVVWIGTVPDFNIDAAQIVFTGKADNCRITVETANTYFIRVGHNDAFSKTPVNVSSAFSLFIPTLTIEELQAISQDAAALHDEIEDVALAALAHLVKYPELDSRAEQRVNAAKTELGTIIEQEISERIEGETAIVEVIDLIGAVSPDGSAFIANEGTFKVSPTESLADWRTQITSEFGDVRADFAEEIELKTGPNSAIVKALNLIGAVTPDGSAFRLNTATFQLQNGSSLAEIVTQVTTENGTFKSDLYENYTSRTTKADTINTKLSLLGSTNAGNTAFVLNESTTKLADGLTFAQWRSSVSAILPDARAYVDQQWTVSGKPGYIQAQNLATLAVEVHGTTGSGGLRGSITTLQDAVAGPNGVALKYGVALDANGRVAGFQINNSTSAPSDFVIVSNRFAIVDPGNPGGPATVPFQYSGGVVYMPDVVVENIKAGTVTADHIIGGAVSTMLHYEAATQQAQAIGVEKEDLAFNFTATGGDVLVNVYGEIGTTTNNAAGSVVRLYCDGSVVGIGNIFCPASWGGVGTAFPFSHRPNPGSHNYRVTYMATTGSGASKINRTLVVVTELKK